MIQRDYIERLIQQVVETLALMLRLREEGGVAQALRAARQTEELVLGPQHQLLARMEAGTLVDLLGRYEVERVRLYAVLVAEEGEVHASAGDGARAGQRRVRALELYAAASSAGARLDVGDRERIARLAGAVGIGAVGEAYRDELAHLAPDARGPR